MPPNVAAFRHGMPWSNSVHKASNWNIFVPSTVCVIVSSAQTFS